MALEKTINNKRIIIINGKFMAERMQGIVRYSRELISALDEIVDDNMDLVLAIPFNAVDVPKYKQIQVQYLGKRSGIAWEQIDLARFVRRQKGAVLLNLCNIAPFFVRPGITAVHDIMYKVNPSHYTTLRNKISRLWHCLQYAYLFRHEKHIITVSEFSKKEIEENYPCARGKITVVPDAWQHVLKYKESTDWQERYPFLEDKGFFFSLATLAKNKNGRWIIETAKNNPDSVFAIAGKKYETEEVAISANVHLLGFVSDEDACALIKHCKAFVYPSIYEGFGLPPLEALALGAEVISSNSTSLPEVLGESVHYIDPYVYDVDLNGLLEKKISERNETLHRYSWDCSAKRICTLLQGVVYSEKDCN